MRAEGERMSGGEAGVRMTSQDKTVSQSQMASARTAADPSDQHARG